jgi:hypothetical protein
MGDLAASSAMKRTLFMAALLAVIISQSVAQSVGKPVQRAFFELRTYSLRFGGNSGALDTYLRDALIPALNRQGVQRVGVFRELGKTEPANVYVLITYASAEQFVGTPSRLRADSIFARVSRDYAALPSHAAPYSRYTSSVMVGFEGMPQLVPPAKPAKLFELRTYEAYSEDALRRKIKMFNDEEFPIFEKANLRSVFFGEVVAGERMPCLTYLLALNSMDERDAGWRAFLDSPDWKRIVKDPQYANTVSNIIRVFLEPVAYSQL